MVCADFTHYVITGMSFFHQLSCECVKSGAIQVFNLRLLLFVIFSSDVATAKFIYFFQIRRRNHARDHPLRLRGRRTPRETQQEQGPHPAAAPRLRHRPPPEGQPHRHRTPPLPQRQHRGPERQRSPPREPRRHIGHRLRPPPHPRHPPHPRSFLYFPA